MGVAGVYAPAFVERRTYEANRNYEDKVSLGFMLQPSLSGPIGQFIGVNGYVSLGFMLQPSLSDASKHLS